MKQIDAMQRLELITLVQEGQDHGFDSVVVNRSHPIAKLLPLVGIYAAKGQDGQLIYSVCHIEQYLEATA